MGKVPVRVNEYFKLLEDDDGIEQAFIYNPPLLAESLNIRVELRKEVSHNRPHVHVIKKGKAKFYDVSFALDDFEIIAGADNLKFFDKNEFQKIVDFIVENQEAFIKVYASIRLR